MGIDQRAFGVRASSDRRARLALAYVVAITLAAVGTAAIDGGRPGAAILVLATLHLLLLIPALVLSIALVHRLQPESRGARALLGAASWGGYGIFVAAVVSLVSQVTLRPEAATLELGLIAASGAVFALLGLDGQVGRPGRVLLLSALIVVALVVVGSITMAGRWGSAA